MKRVAIAFGIATLAAVSCANDGDGSQGPSCQDDNDCGAAGNSAGHAEAPAGGLSSHAGATNNGGTGSGEQDGALPGAPHAGSSNLAGAGNLEGWEGLAVAGAGGLGGGGDGGSSPESQPACAERYWQAEQPVAGADFSAFSRGRPLSIAGDGSAFAAWLSSDASYTRDYANVSRYTPGSGWEPLLQFDNWEAAYSPESGPLDLPPVAAASENGEAMLLWGPIWFSKTGPAPAGSLMAMRHAAGWQVPISLQGLEGSAYEFDVGSDALGNFVAAWLSWQKGVYSTKMVSYSREGGWGLVESVAGVQPYAVGVSMDPGGKALVVWADGDGIVAERFSPSGGWNGPEVLLERTPSTAKVGPPKGAIGRDGSAVVTWTNANSPLPTHPLVSAFSGRWSPPKSLDGAGAILPTSEPLLATDSHGTFLVGWTSAAGAYVSQLAPGTTWSTPAQVSKQPAANAEDAYVELRLAMNEHGDAALSWFQQTKQDSTSSLMIATSSPSLGWTAPTPLDHRSVADQGLLLDACGNATLVWEPYAGAGVMAARRVSGGSWSQALPLGAGSLGALALGSNGDVIATLVRLNEPGPYRIFARVLTAPEVNP